MPRINHNVPALVTSSSLRRVGQQVSKSLEKLSTGLRINRAADDAAGLSVSESLRTQVRGLQMASRNIQDGISLLNIAEGALIEVSDMLQRIRELSIQASNDTNTIVERGYIQTEIDQIMNEIDRISESTQFAGQKLLNGTDVWGTTNGGVLHVGPNDTVNADIVTVYVGAITTGGMGLIPVDVTSQTGATNSIGLVDTALQTLNTLRADLGARTNRLEHALNNQENEEENMTAAESVIRDVDFATETTAFSRAQILQQSSTAMLAQANLVPQSVLQLLQ
jgi:flagellin